MTERTELEGRKSRKAKSVKDRFSDFQHVVSTLGLSSFVAFAIHKNFDHSEISLLDDDQKEILMDECEPLIAEALGQRGTLQ